MLKVAVSQTADEDFVATVEDKKDVPPFGTLEYIQYWSELEGGLPSPIDVSITGAVKYTCPDLVWYNFDIYPHKIKLTNTGYTVLFGAKWRTERPYLEGGPFLEKHVFSQAHFHWGANMMEGSEHTVDQRRYPGEMQVMANGMCFDMGAWAGIWAIFFRSEYMTQEEAMHHPDGVVVICYMIKYGVNPDERLQWVIEGFPRIREAQTHTRIGPYPMSRLFPMFYEDYFLYWGNLTTVKGENFTVRWLVPRITLFASFEQIKEFRKLWDPWDEPNLRNFRPLQEKEDRHVFFIRPHWNQYNSLLQIPRVPELSISVISPEYQAKLWMLPLQNAYMLPQQEKEKEESKTNQNENPNIEE